MPDNIVASVFVPSHIEAPIVPTVFMKRHLSVVIAMLAPSIGHRAGLLH